MSIPHEASKDKGQPSVLPHLFLVVKVVALCQACKEELVVVLELEGDAIHHEGGPSRDKVQDARELHVGVA